jgi:peptidoglycan hydrolase-like protein with peptidoglycan-binding domain
MKLRAKHPAFFALFLLILNAVMVNAAWGQAKNLPPAALLQEANRFYAEAQKKEETDRLVAYRNIRDILDRIVADYPASDAAFTILSGQEIAGLDLAAIDRALRFDVKAQAAERREAKAEANTGPTKTDDDVENTDQSEREVAPTERTGQTDSDEATQLAPSQTSDDETAERENKETALLSANGVDQDQDPAPDSTYQAATQATDRALGLDRNGVRDLQSRLTAMAFEPKGIDGLMGQNTRKAISAWQKRDGIPATGYLDKPQLAALKQASQAALDSWLKSPENKRKYEEPKPIPLTPRVMAGDWTFTARCGRNSKAPGRTFTGAIRMNHQGNGVYAGRARNSQGFVGDFAARVRGRGVEASINWGLLIGRVSISGRIADRAIILNGRDSNGCRVSARK